VVTVLLRIWNYYFVINVSYEILLVTGLGVLQNELYIIVSCAIWFKYGEWGAVSLIFNYVEQRGDFES
jgi:hypothetical protein